MPDVPVIFWFRRDLRLRDNWGLAEAIKSGQPVIPVFIFDSVILNSPRFSDLRYKFMIDGLAALDAELKKFGTSLLIKSGKPADVLARLSEVTGANALFFNKDYTPYSRKRDEAVTESFDIDVNSFDDRLLVPPGEIMKDDGSPYVVYTPFMKRWRDLAKPDSVDDSVMKNVSFYNINVLYSETLPEVNDSEVDLPNVGEASASERLETFLSGAVYDYAKTRDFPGNYNDSPHTSTSFLSPYIRFGMISPRKIYWSARQAYDDAKSDEQRKSVSKFVDEVIWHEFYTHILWHFPHVKTENFNDKYDVVEWREDEEQLEAWKAGKTGYPLVDAAMRQLKAAGWMHNRTRMIVASFLTKDLLIHWKKGELHFVQWLIDGDLAANNGGWQWAAGTGTDAQPYFRIFNPITQSKKYDPDGEFIRYWIPELRDVPTERIHAPWEMDNPPEDYPSPIVDHSMARERTLEAFEATKA